MRFPASSHASKLRSGLFKELLLLSGLQRHFFATSTIATIAMMPTSRSIAATMRSSGSGALNVHLLQFELNKDFAPLLLAGWKACLLEGTK